RAHDAHLAPQDVPELGQLVEAGPPQQAPGPRDPGILPAADHGLLVLVHAAGRTVHHGPELQDLERAPVLADPRLAEEDRPRAVQPRDQRDEPEGAGQRGQRPSAHGHVERPLHPVSHDSPIASVMTELTSSTSYFDSAIRRDSAPIPTASSGSARKRRIALASGATCRGGTRKPLTPSTTVSRQPGASQVMTARPTLIASSTDRGVPSR